MPTSTTPDPLETWIAAATTDLCDESVERIRADITEHVSSAMKRAQDLGRDLPSEHRLAIEGLGDPLVARKQFLRNHFTKQELEQLKSGDSIYTIVGCFYLWVSLFVAKLCLTIVFGVDLLSPVIEQFGPAIVFYLPPVLISIAIIIRSNIDRSQMRLTRGLVVSIQALNALGRTTLGLVAGLFMFGVIWNDWIRVRFLEIGNSIGSPNWLTFAVLAVLGAYSVFEGLCEAMPPLALARKTLRIAPRTIVIR